jgi:hypothetical protein
MIAYWGRVVNRVLLFTSHITCVIMIAINTMAITRAMSLPRGIPERKRQRLKALLPARKWIPLASLYL